MIQTVSRWLRLALVPLALSTLIACEDDPTDPDPGPPQQTDVVLAGAITGERILSADTTYILQGTVTVDDAGVLRIPAGTLILGDVNAPPTVLIVRQGGQIYAEGTADAPIVFTSSNPPGQRARGDWGGIVINGRSLCNYPAEDCVGEGNSGTYGGDQLDDNSGVMTYVRIEYAGYEVSSGNELNALTLNGVGSGTTLHHIQAHFGSDDGIEFFGGTVDLKYALVTGASDDSFDYSTGWRGRGQFWIAQQDPNDAGNGFEVDGNEADYDAEPFTSPVIYNVTLVGKGGTGSASESEIGLLLRRGTAGAVHNAVVMGFGVGGLDIDNTETVDRVDSGDLVVANSIFFENTPNFSADDDDDGIDDEAIGTASAWGNRVTDPGLIAPYDRQAPDFRPADGSAALEGFATPPEDDFFDTVDFAGGVSPDGTPWYEGWITLEQS